MDRSATGFENYANQSVSCTVNTQAEHTQAKTRLMCEHMQTSSCSCVYESMKYLRLRVVDCTNTSLRSYKVRWRTFLEYEYYINRIELYFSLIYSIVAPFHFCHFLSSLDAYQTKDIRDTKERQMERSLDPKLSVHWY